MNASSIGGLRIGTVQLRAVGAERALPDRWLGYNSPAPYNLPIEDPGFARAVRALRPHYLRFPGGTVANYFQWREGQLLLGEHPDHPVYRQYALRSRRLHPNGVFIEQYAALAKSLDARLLVVPNLETSTVDEQAAWFAKMNADGFVPAEIEMGNEFFLAFMLNPVTLARFPDWGTTLRLMKQYSDAIRPYIAADARIAVQAAASTFHNPTGRGVNPYFADEDVGARVARRERQWDADMQPEAWFDAVTVHLYPTIEGSAGVGSLNGMQHNLRRIFAACLARVDEGYDRALSDTIARMPGKEIWITEWGAFEPAALLHGTPVSFNGIWLHMIARGLMAILRHPQVTIATNHSLFCDGNLMSTFRCASASDPADRAADSNGSAVPGDSLVPINAAGLIAWFCEASRGPGVAYRQVDVDGAIRIVGEGTVAGEGFRDVAACLFRRGREHTLFVQNASGNPRDVDLSALIGADTRVNAEVIETPDLLLSLQMAAPQPRPVLPSALQLQISAYSIARIAWTG